LKDNFY